MKELGLISLEQKPIYDKYLKKYPTELSEQNFTNLFMWQRPRPKKTIEASGSLITYEERDEGTIIFGPPIGPMPLGEALEIVESTSGKDVVVCERISERAAAPNISSNWEIMENEPYYDYRYLRNDLAGLEGRKYHRKRNLIAQCLAHYDCTYEELSSDNIAEVSDMMDRWCDHHRCKEERGLCNEFRATRTVLQNYKELGVIGAAIRIEGQIEAFTVGEALNDDTAVIHLEKAMPTIKGLYQVINKWFCLNHLSSFKYVNREQDLGIPGLRQAKKSYFPDRMIKKYIIYPYGKERGQLAEAPKIKRCLDEEG